MEDVDGMHAICSDARVWTHFTSLRQVDVEQTRTTLEQFMATWEKDGQRPWVVRLPGRPEIIGQGGCSVKDDVFWNLRCRFAPAVQGCC
ncbi:GNAT family N-acetyltransferase [Arthrobacter sp. LAPM80]|uniref:GNAT family N-acetyltransferase n=1 Tax=Arthrobacter sp. LAPM80 TaxID=3141788 RepID=UPI00398B1CFF